ncbi:unnamed protein product [Schistocephalus solidus]|uniref:ANK_REP_REGION domain-containing protein n=1 Tax=Schistocephalus solidus TaxID=70667 RepID=A0A183TJD5_SCHSO|nr:unnamed protein product [Schistocephalus solidus]
MVLWIGPRGGKKPVRVEVLACEAIREVDLQGRLFGNAARRVEAVNPATQDSPLHLLCRGFCSSAPPDHQRRLLEELLLAGANTQILDPSGQSSLHLSILHQNEVAFQVLLANVEYCDVNLLNRDGISPLWLALVAHFVSKPLNDAAIRSLSNLGFAGTGDTLALYSRGSSKKSDVEYL